MKVLSLFDGISCGMVALERANIKVDEYVAYEIDKYAIQVSQKNYPQIQQKGSVVGADFTQYKGFDLLIGGSPCQDLCAIGSRKGLKGEKSGLFYEYIRALKEVKPAYFLLENVASMTKENRDIITSIMGVEPIEINSNFISAQDRKRLYWTNIPFDEIPKDKGLCLRDIVQPESEKLDYDITERMKAKVKGTLAYKKTWSNVRTLDRKFRCITATQGICNSGSTNISYPNGRYYKPTPIECERGQTLPDNYTQGLSDTQRYKCIGNGWTVDVIAHIFKGLMTV